MTFAQMILRLYWKYLRYDNSKFFALYTKFAISLLMNNTVCITTQIIVITSHLPGFCRTTLLIVLEDIAYYNHKYREYH